MEENPPPAPDPQGPGRREHFSDDFARAAAALYAWAALRKTTRFRFIRPEEFVQEVWTHAVARSSDFDPTRGAFRSWILGLAKDVSQKIEGAKTVGEGEDAFEWSPARVPHDAISISQAVARDEGLNEWIDTVRALPRAERGLVVLCGIEGVAPGEAAQTLSIEPKDAEEKWRRVRASLENRGTPEGIFA